MKIGIPEYEITYLGDPVGINNEVQLADPVADLIGRVSLVTRYNQERGFTTTVIDVSEFDFIEELIDSFETCPFNTSPLSGKSHHTIYFYIPKDYYLGSQSETVVSRTKTLFKILFHIIDHFSENSGIVCRIGSAYGNRKKTMASFIVEYKSLPDFVSRRIVLTNDDRPSLFSVKDLLSDVCIENKIPIAFRSLSHYFNSGSLFYGDAIKLSFSTWPKGKIPLVIHSESKDFNEDGIPESRNPSDNLSYRIPTFGLNVCVAIDSGHRELSCFKYIADYHSLKPVVINRTK